MDFKTLLLRLAKYVGIPFGILLVLFGTFRIVAVNHIDNYEIGYQFDRRTGETTIIQHQGYVVTWPIMVKVHTIDLRPMQVRITSNTRTQYSTGVNERVLNCKLVRFNHEGLMQFVKWHGRDDYDGDKLGDLLKAYAYEDAGMTYPFLEVMRELRTRDSHGAN